MKGEGSFGDWDFFFFLMVNKLLFELLKTDMVLREVAVSCPTSATRQSHT